MEINNSKPIKNLSFQGYQHKKTEFGTQAYEFNCIYDSSKYDCELQCFKVGYDEQNKNFFIKRGTNNKMEPFFKIDVPKNGVKVEPDYDLGLSDEQPFAFRFALKEKGSDKVVKFLQEDGNNLDGCSLVSRKGTSVSKQGPMYLAIADTLAPGYVYAGFKENNTGEIIPPDDEKKAEISDMIHSASRTFSNTFGGTLAGLEAKIPELREAGVKRLITCPLKGGDNASSHKYWNENNMLIAGGLGNINNYDSLQREAFKNGMNLVDDGTFTSEGLQGIHFQRAIKWMDNENKPDEYYYFRMSGLQDDSLGLGVIPANCENVRPKLINCPFDVIPTQDGQYKFAKNEKYDPSQPTFFQIYDDSLVSDEQRNDKTHVITKYAKTGTDSKLSMNTHDDTPVPYSVEVSNPEELKKNFKSLNEVNRNRDKSDRISYYSPQGAMFIGSLSGIRIEPKQEGGFVCWDANTDMVKLNYFTSNYDSELLLAEKNPAKRAIEMDKYRVANAQVQDMAMSAGKYWTKHVRNTHNEYVAKTIGAISDKPAKAYNRISGILDTQNPSNPKLPEDVRLPREVVQNVLEGNYELRPRTSDYDTLIESSMMDLPLDSIEFANDTAGALSSPYLSKRASDSDHVGISRYEAKNDKSYNVPKKYSKVYNKMNKVFDNEIKDFAGKVLSQVDKHSSEKLFDKNGVTEYGQYVIPLVAEDIAKYAIVKSMMPEVEAKQLKNGEIAYDYDTMREKGTLRNLGINGDSQEDEANQIVNKIRDGVKDLQADDVLFVSSSINNRIANTNANSFKLAEVMVDRSGLGLDWRLDAAKDIADMDSVRNGAQTFDTAWDNVINFWGNFVSTVKEENPSSYIVAEITDLNELMNVGKPDDNDVVYKNASQASSAFFDVAGITSEANYGYFFNGISNMFGYDFASGTDKVGNNDDGRVSKLESSLGEFAQQSIDYKRNSYTFAGNHDKARMVHCLSMDMSLFHADLSNLKDVHHRTQAYMLMNDKMNKNDLTHEDWNKIKGDSKYFNNISSKAIANGDLLRASIGSVNEAHKNSEKAEVSKSNMSEGEKQARYSQIDEKYNDIYSALSKSVADVVSGKYHKGDVKNENRLTPDTLKKINEQEGFGSKSIPDAFDIVYDQAVNKYGLDDKLDADDMKRYRDDVDTKATEVGRAKTRIIMRYLYALSGNPTLYAGDELGMTGYEDKCMNTFLQNRNPLDWSIVEGDEGVRREEIVSSKNDLYDMSRTRKDDDMNKMEALNNGTMYKLDVQQGYDKNNHEHTLKASAILSQASNGAMNISVLNPNGISTDPRISVNHLKPTDMKLDSIYLKTQKGKMSLNEGTVFKNVNPNDDAEYRVCKHKDDYFIKRFPNGSNYGEDVVLDGETAPDGVLMLYHIPEDIKNERTELINKKKRTREYFNTKYNISSGNEYDNTHRHNGEQGRNVDFTSK
jgi:hypothetical protein